VPNRGFKYCPRCGAEFVTQVLENVERLVCPHCGFVFYRNPTPAVAVILRRGDQILLTKRRYEPRRGDWSLPAGFIEYHEEPEQTAIREAKEETNLDIRLAGLQGVYFGTDDPRVHILLVVYWGEIVSGELMAGDDAEEARFFPLNSLPDNIAFSTHLQILQSLGASGRC
jgi:8-oxo-dGTP diphosphatase